MMMLWLHYFRPRPAWYSLDPQQQSELIATWTSIGSTMVEERGAASLGEYSVRGQSTHERVQVWKFAAVTDLEDFWTDLSHAGYSDWRESENVMGVPEIPVEYVPAPEV